MVKNSREICPGDDLQQLHAVSNRKYWMRLNKNQIMERDCQKKKMLRWIASPQHKLYNGKETGNHTKWRCTSNTISLRSGKSDNG